MTMGYAEVPKAARCSWHLGLATLLWLAALQVAWPSDKEEQLGSAQWWLKRAVEEADAITPLPQRVEYWPWLAHAAAKLGDDRLLDQIFKRMEADASNENAKSEVSYLQAKGLMVAGRFQAARQTADRIPDLERRRFIHREILLEEAKQGRLEEAKASIATMPREWRARAYRALARDRAYVDFPFAFELIKQIPAGQRGGWDLRYLSNAAIHSKDSENVNGMLRLALDEVELGKDVVRMALEYVNIAEPIAEAGELRIDPDLRHRLAENLRKLANRSNDFRAQEYLVESLLALREFEDAKSVIARVEAEVGQVRLRGKLALTLVKRARFEEALALIESGQLNLGAGRRDGAADGVYEGIALAKMKAGDFQGAEAMAEKIAQRHYGRDGVFFELARGRLEAGDVQAAKAFVPKITKGWQQVDLYVSIARYQASNGQSHAARQTLREAASAAEKIQDRSSRSQAIARVAIEQAKQGDLESAIRNARFIPFARNRYQAFFSIAKQQLEDGQRESFEKRSQLALEAASEITNVEEGEQACCYARLALLFAKAKQPDRFREAMTEALKAAQKAHGHFWKYGAYGTIVGTYREAKRIEELPAAIDRIGPPLDRAVACYAMAVLIRPSIGDN